jgi:hypothetical protein
MRFKVQVLSHDVAPNDLLHYTQCRLNAWARWEVAQGAHEHRDPIPIYVCCVWLVF